ncbi:Rho-associated protein kinase let-502 [Thelohanellus kitauei]|uniref:non-specific serine/threonine protein kinase n=1 Tax=Thelohanellus kitauei TaxID=669202 RepID=A0A0C2MUP3_THEKT|nr:Rho-associated protein kinase let-502 [Thelohanellus kitauei]
MTKPPTCQDRFKKLSSSLFDQNSYLNIDTLLDCASSIAYELDQTSSTNSKCLSTVLDRLKSSTKFIQSSRVNISDFSVLKILGSGAFGEVSLVKHKETGNIYALKSMNKYEMVKRDEALCLWEEREIMALSNTEWLVRMYHAFQDALNIYMVMEFVQGGDMVHFMGNYEIDENVAKFYIAELSLALDFLHDLGFIHRDVKPDNMLLDRSGHLKLCDFGTCIRMNKSGKVSCAIAVGTPDYIAPEVLNSQNNKTEYGKEVDWWSVGIFLYEFLIGDTPFYAESYIGTYMKILNYKTSLVFPDDIEVSDIAKDLIRRFLTEPIDRLGSNGICSVKAHHFFDGVSWSWDNIRNCIPPVVPEISGDIDTSCFDSNPESNKPAEQSQLAKPPQGGGFHYPFIGFSFTPDLATSVVEPTVCKQEPTDASALNFKKQIDEKQSLCDKMTELLENKTLMLIEANEKVNEYTKTLDSIKEENQKHIARIKDLESQLSANAQNIKKMEVQIKFVKMSESETKKRYDELSDQIRPMKESLETFKGLASNLESSVSDLNQELVRSKASYDEAVSDLQKMSQSYQTLKQEVDSLKFCLGCETIEQSKTVAENIMASNRELSAKLKQSEIEIKEYEEKHKNNSALEDDRMELSTKNRKLTLDVATLQMLADHLRSQISELNHKNSDQLNSLTESQQECKDLNKKLSDANSKLAASIQMESRLSNEKKQMIARENELQSRLDKYLESLRAFEKRITSYDEQLSYAEIKLNLQTKKIEDLENDMLRREEIIVTLNGEIINLKKQHEEQQQELNCKNSEIIDLKQQSDKYQAQIAMLSLDVSETSSKQINIGVESGSPSEISDEMSILKIQLANQKKQADEDKKKYEKIIENERLLKDESIRKLNEIMNMACFKNKNATIAAPKAKAQPVKVDRKLEQMNKQLQMDYNKISDEYADMRKKYDDKISELNATIVDLQTMIDLMKRERSDEDKLRSQELEWAKLSNKSSERGSLSKADQVVVIKQTVLFYPNKTGKSGRKILWDPVMVILTNRELTIYKDMDETQKPMLVIKIAMMYYVRAIHQNDLIRGLPGDIPKIFQVIYNDETEAIKQNANELSSEKCTTINNHCLINIQYHMPATCDICGKGLWGFIKSSYAIECKNCHFKCHRDHANDQKSFPPCRDYENRRMAKEILLKAPNTSDQKYWIETLLRLMKEVASAAGLTPMKHSTSKR